MADANHYEEAAAGLEEAAKALRACGEEEASENESGEDTPRSRQPKSLRDARQEAKKRYAKDRGEKAPDDDGDE